MTSTESPFFGVAVERPEELPTGIPELDAKLGGGLLFGQLVEISGGPSSGKASLALFAALSSLRARKAVAWIDPLGRFFPLPALETGAPLDNLVVVRPTRERDPLRCALRAAQLVLSAPGAVALVILQAPPAFQVPDSTLLRLQRLCERSRTTLVFLTERLAQKPSLGSVISLRLHVRRTSRRSFVEILRNKWGVPGAVAIELPRLRPLKRLENSSFPL
jgi:hypothetical protein